MKLFQRIFATFCAVISCAILAATLSFWLVQSTIAENHYNQRRNLEIGLLQSTLSAFHNGGEAAVRRQLNNWGQNLDINDLYIIRGDDNNDIFDRPVSEDIIKQARNFSLSHPDSPLVRMVYTELGEEYLFFIANWDKPYLQTVPPPFLIPGLALAPIWHEVIILIFIIVVGLLTAYILTNNITHPIKLLSQGMNRLASGDLETRVSHQLARRQDELYQLATHFDSMAEKLQKLVEKERHLLHHVSHEMRSPLARMQAILGLIQVQPQKQDIHLQRLESELSRMDQLVGELLTLSRLETANIDIEKEALMLVPFLQQLLEDNNELASQKHQSIIWNCTLPENAQIMGNAGLLYRAFDNVIRNAIAYSPENSQIHICINEEDKHHWKVDISDNGPGVNPTQLPHIFTAFYRADSSANKPGTGLGLALTKHIMECHQGCIYAENLTPNGLVIHFILPKWQDKKK